VQGLDVGEQASVGDGLQVGSSRTLEYGEAKTDADLTGASGRWSSRARENRRTPTASTSVVAASAACQVTHRLRGRISYLKRRYGFDRTPLDGLPAHRPGAACASSPTTP
jgi:hypothetical protein